MKEKMDQQIRPDWVRMIKEIEDMVLAMRRISNDLSANLGALSFALHILVNDHLVLKKDQEQPQEQPEEPKEEKPVAPFDGVKLG